jgi:hypothetical protein
MGYRDMRTQIYQALKNSTGLTDLVGDRIFQASTLENVPDRPFITYRIHGEYRVQILGQRAFVQVWCQDDPGDYLRIDQMIDFVKEALESIPHQDRLLQVRWAETSVDLKDDDMHTICRNTRFQVTQAIRM